MKARRHYALVVAIILLSFILVRPQYNQAVTVKTEDPLTRAVHAAGATVQEVTVNGWSKLSLPELTDEEMTGVAKQAMDKLGIKPGQYQISHHRSANHRQVKAEALADRSHVVVIVQILYPSWEEKGCEVYLVVNIDKATPEESAANIQGKIIRLISDIGGSPRVTTCLVGWLDGKLEEEERVLRLNKAFKVIDASVVNSLSYSNLASYSGFTPLVSEWLTVGSDRVNINMAIRYSQYDNRTYVMVGSPVITREY